MGTSAGGPWQRTVRPRPYITAPPGPPHPPISTKCLTWARRRTEELPAAPAQRWDKSQTSVIGNATSSYQSTTTGYGAEEAPAQRVHPGGNDKRTDGATATKGAKRGRPQRSHNNVLFDDEEATATLHLADKLQRVAWQKTAHERAC